MNGIWMYSDPNGIIAAQIEYDDHTGKTVWAAYDLTTEGSIPKIGTYSELGLAKTAVEEYFRPPAKRQAVAL
jgi:hypothetical protein